MKVYKKERIECHGGKYRILFATNVKELELLYGVVQQASLHIPKHPIRFSEEYDRIKNIKRALGEGLKMLKEE